MGDSTKSKLNPAQQKAVETVNGPLLVVAGAGSGKTLVLAHRVVHLIENGVRPSEILAITFTNKAAEEMRDRITRLIAPGKRPRARFAPDSYSRPWIGTFHSLCAFILRESGKAVGILRSFSILDEEDSIALIKEALEELSLDPKQFEPRRMKALISQKKNEMETVEKFRESASEYFPKILAQIWSLYEEKAKKSITLDFDDLLLRAVELFSKHPLVLEAYQERWKFIQVDEYQDTNIVQYHLARLLAQKYRNICVVGDIDQAIYSWRGADFRNILHFERDWPEATLVTLEENYRSTQLILEAANAVIVKNKLRVPKNLFSARTSGAKIMVSGAENEEEEAGGIIAMIHSLMGEGMRPKEIAVLYRTNFQSRVIEEKLLTGGIPYQVVGVKFYERREIKDALAYLRAALNEDDLISAKRVINTPPRGIGKVLCAKFLAHDPLSKREQEKVSAFTGALEEVKNKIETGKCSEVMRFAIERTGLEAFWDNGGEEGAMRIQNLEELTLVAKRYDENSGREGVAKLLEDAALMSEQDTLKKDDSIKLMTVHAAKGLEFSIVFIAGLEEGLFPHRLAGDEEELRREEERRLFYVALTRAKEKVILSYAVFRTLFGMRQINLPSQFIADIPEELLERVPENIATFET